MNFNSLNLEFIWLSSLILIQAWNDLILDSCNNSIFDCDNNSIFDLNNLILELEQFNIGLKLLNLTTWTPPTLILFSNDLALRAWQNLILDLNK